MVRALRGRSATWRVRPIVKQPLPCSHGKRKCPHILLIFEHKSLRLIVCCWNFFLFAAALLVLERRRYWSFLQTVESGCIVNLTAQHFFRITWLVRSSFVGTRTFTPTFVIIVDLFIRLLYRLLTHAICELLSWQRFCELNRRHNLGLLLKAFAVQF